jgi:hypothetical protein
MAPQYAGKQPEGHANPLNQSPYTGKLSGRPCGLSEA